MRILMSAIVVATTLLPLAASAQAYRAENQLIVVPLAHSTFEVMEARGEGPRGIWCAAASFALDRLGTARAARVYVKERRGPSRSKKGQNSVVFTTNAAALSVAPLQSNSLSTRVVGMGLPVHHAKQFCVDYLLDIYDRDY